MKVILTELNDFAKKVVSSVSKLVRNFSFNWRFVIFQ